MLDLTGKKGLIVGVANQKSIAWGCANILHKGGAELALTYYNEKAKPHVVPLAELVEAQLLLPLNVTEEGQVDDVFKAIKTKWGKLDFVIHSIAYAPIDDLHGRVIDSSKEGFSLAMEISCYSFINFSKYAEALMPSGGSLLTMTYYGSEKVIPHYGIMGPVKAALESTVRYVASELGDANVRVNAISPGPISTRAASGIARFEDLLSTSEARSPLRRGVTIDDVGNFAAFLVSDLSRHITGGVHYVDAGYEILG